MGLVDNKIGRFNSTVILCVLSTIFTLGVWINATTYTQLIVLSICFGIMIGVGNLMNLVLTADMFGPEQLVPHWATLNFLNTVPVAVVEVGALELRGDTLKKTHIYTHRYSSAVSFCVFSVSFLFMLLTRQVVVKHKYTDFRRKVKRQECNDGQIDDDSKAIMVRYDWILEDSWNVYFRRVFIMEKI